MPKPEAVARERIDAALTVAGWAVQDATATNLSAARGVAVREFPLVRGHGFADYLLYVDGKAAGVVEAKKEGETLTGVELQATKYSEGLPPALPAHIRPLPFLYQSTGVETRFTNDLDPEPRSRRVFAFHRSDVLASWLAARPQSQADAERDLAAEAPPPSPKPLTLRARLRRLPPLVATGLWPAQIRAVMNLERSLAEDRPRALIQMATGSGKTFTAITSIYRLVKFAGAQRVLFLVDRGNLGRQALRSSLRGGDLLLAIRGTYGRVAEVPPELDGGNITQDSARLDVTEQLNHRYVATFLRCQDAQNYFKRVARGVAVQGR